MSASTRAPLLLLCAILAGPVSAYDIPEVPEDRDWISDHANLINAQDRQAIHEAMARSGQAHSTAIMVVTIGRMSDYVEDEGAPRIEDLAREWFDTWEIGLEEYNTGMLLLVSQGDRKARIELGAAWGRRWDGHCKRIMDNEIVSRFKQGEFSAGIREGVLALERMAALGPNASPPAPGFLESLQNTELARKIDTYQPLPMGIAALLIVIGVALCIGAFFVNPDAKKMMLIAGGLFILMGVSIYLLMIIFGAFSKNRGGSSSSGFGGGGFSGGGGATGSW